MLLFVFYVIVESNMIVFVIVERDRPLQYDILRTVLLANQGVWSDTGIRLVRVQQTHKFPFNRGLLFNVGFLFSNVSSHVVFHDVDMIPETTVPYGNTSFPVIQYATRASQFQYKLPYDNYLGGVVGFNPNAFRLINGFSNKFWGWGGEDDDLFRRVKRRHLEVDHATRGRFLSTDHPRAPRVHRICNTMWEYSLVLFITMMVWQTHWSVVIAYASFGYPIGNFAWWSTQLYPI